MDLQVIPYNNQDHYDMVSQWWKEWMMNVPPKSAYPQLGGFIVPGVYAAFLYATGTCIAFYENVIANPKSNKTERHQAIVMIDEAITQYAKEIGVIVMVGKSYNKSILAHAKSNGWELEKEYTMIKKFIKENS